MGRYPFHIHLAGDGGSLSYIADSSIHHSYFRAVTVHGSNYVQVTGNVAYDIVGHAYYMEDGVEENNTFAYNIGAYIHFLKIYDPAFTSGGQFLATTYADPVYLIVPSDITASPFYITNSYNSYVGNVAVGGWSGFAFPNLNEHFNQSSIVPNTRAVKLFDGNSAHSTAFWWEFAGGIYVGGVFSVDANGNNASYNPGRGGSFAPTSPSLFTNTKTFLVNTGFMHWGAGESIGRVEALDVSSTGSQVFGKGVVMRQYFVGGRTRHTPDLLNGCRISSVFYSNKCAPRDTKFYFGNYRGLQWYVDVGITKHVLLCVIFYLLR